MTDPTSLPTFGQENPLRSRVIDALLDAGYEPTLDSDGDVAIRTQDQTLFVRCLDSQPALMRVFGQWLLDDSLPGDELTRLRASNAVTGALNLIKCTLHQDRLSVAVDLVVGADIELAPLLASSLDAIIGSVRTWHGTVTELLEGGTGEITPHS